MIPEIIFSFAIFLIILFFRIISVTLQIQKARSSSKTKTNHPGGVPKRQKPAVTLIVLGSGGHTTEMMSLQSKLNPEKYKPIVHVIATTDHTSENRVQQKNAEVKQQLKQQEFKSTGNVGNSVSVDVTYRIPRSREVGQSYFSSIFTTLYAFLYAVKIVYRVQPDIVLCNGPGTCLPIAAISFFFGKWRRILFPWPRSSLDLNETKLVFVESFCRVQHLSLTGKLLYPFVDRFVVHWDELHAKYPLTTLVETFVRRS